MNNSDLVNYRESALSSQLDVSVPSKSLWHKFCCFFGFHTWGPTLSEDRKIFKHGDKKIMLFHDDIIECKHCLGKMDTRKGEPSITTVIEAFSSQWEGERKDGITYLFLDTYAEYYLKSPEQRAKENEERQKQRRMIAICPAMFS